MAVNRSVSKVNNPYYSNVLGGASIAVGAEGSNQITLTIQFKTNRSGDVGERTSAFFYLSADANGDVPAHGIHAPNGGYAIGTDGTFVRQTFGPAGLSAIGTLAIDAVPEKFKTTTTATFFVGGFQTTKAAATAIVFSAAHVITANTFGVVLIQVNAAGTVSTVVPSATQAYASAALALAALPQPTVGNVALGYIAIANNAGDWTANTDDLTNASDVTTAAFVDAPLNSGFPTGVQLLSEADGDVDIIISETRVRSFYANLVMPDGSKVTSSVIAFA